MTEGRSHCTHGSTYFCFTFSRSPRSMIFSGYFSICSRDFIGLMPATLYELWAFRHGWVQSIYDGTGLTVEAYPNYQHTFTVFGARKILYGQHMGCRVGTRVKSSPKVIPPLKRLKKSEPLYSREYCCFFFSWFCRSTRSRRTATLRFLFFRAVSSD